MNTLRFVGVDPGFANVGFCIVDVYPIGAMQLVATRLVTTKPDKKQRDDEQHRLILIEDEFREFIKDQDVSVLAMEAPTAGMMPGRKIAATGKRGWAVNPTVVRQTSLAWGGLHGICRDRGIYCVKVELGEIKRRLGGKKTASKSAVIEQVKKKFPTYTDWPKSKKVEHVADAVGAVLAAQTDPVVMVMLKGLKS